MSAQARLVLIVSRVIASDPGGLGWRRASRVTLSFLLTLLLIWGVGTVVGQPVMAMALGFPVSIFACAIVREDDARARLIAMGGLVIAAAASFTASALVTNAWINHALFVALVFGAVYVRRWGSRWMAAGFGAFVSFFFGAFLAPPPSGLPWHLLGLLLATAAALTVQFVVLAHDAAASLDRVMHAIDRRLSLLLAPLERGRARDQDAARLRSELHLLKSTVATARAQLDATDGGWRAATDLSFHLFEVEAAAERLVWVATGKGEAADIAGAGQRTAGQRTAALRAWLATGVREPLALPPAPNAVGEGLEELRDAVVRLHDARAHRQATDAPAPSEGPETRAPDRQHGLTPTTRLAIQASVACALAVVGGEILSPHRWYWAVITVFVMFSNTASRGDALFKSLERLAGTVAGVVAGVGLVWLVGGDWFLQLALLLATIFLTFYFFVERYSVMVFFLTVMLAVLYALLDRFTPGVMWLRLGETAVGATAGILVSSLLLPRATGDHVRERFLDLVEATAGFADVAVDRLAEGHGRSLGAHGRDFDAAYAAMREAIRPLWLDRLGGGAALHDTVGEALQACSYWVHELGLAGRGSGERVGDAERHALLGDRARLRERLDRLRERVAVGERSGGDGVDDGPAVGRPPRSEEERLEVAARALDHLSAALNRIGDAIASGGREVRFFRF